jgi:formate hydrogenlyase subunit 6/NADH:ubiquinone oxidoreductase subunit I
MDGEDVAEIDKAACIRCGKCHDACPQEAVRHDGERIPQEVNANLQWVERLAKHFPVDKEQDAFLERMVRYFTKERTVAERTLDGLRSMAKGDKEAGG